eukprot:2962520-Alexandrium_andersonii.AAC.1
MAGASRLGGGVGRPLRHGRLQVNDTAGARRRAVAAPRPRRPAAVRATVGGGPAAATLGMRSGRG